MNNGTMWRVVTPYAVAEEKDYGGLDKLVYARWGFFVRQIRGCANLTVVARSPTRSAKLRQGVFQLCTARSYITFLSRQCRRGLNSPQGYHDALLQSLAERLPRATQMGRPCCHVVFLEDDRRRSNDSIAT